jgi:hypothetical protein
LLKLAVYAGFGLLGKSDRFCLNCRAPKPAPARVNA